MEDEEQGFAWRVEAYVCVYRAVWERGVQLRVSCVCVPVAVGDDDGGVVREAEGVAQY